MLKATSSSGAVSALSSYVVGTGGTYAGTDAGLQAAINAAHAAGASVSAPVVIYVLPTYAGTSAQITLYDGINITGLVGESSPGALTVFTTIASQGNNNRIVIIPNQFTITGSADSSTSFSNVNLTYNPGVTSAQFTFSVTTGNPQGKMSFNNVTCAAGGSCNRMFDLTTSTGSSFSLTLYVTGSTFDNYNGNTASFFKLLSDGTSSSNIFLNAQDSTFFFPSTRSTFTGGGNGFGTDLSECNIVMPVQLVSGANNAYDISTIGGMVGLTAGFNLITGFDGNSNGDSLSLQAIGTQFICDRTGGTPSVLGSCPGVTFPRLVGTNLTDTVWSSDATTNTNALSVMINGAVSFRITGNTFSNFYASNIITSGAYTGGTIDGVTIGSSAIVSTQAYRPANTQTLTTYTLVLADAGKLITLSNASPVTLTIPANASVAFPVGTEIDLLSIGVGIVTVVITTDTLLSKAGKVTLSAQYSGGSLRKVAPTTWVLVGDLA